MKRYVCAICGYVFDESKDGKWEDLPDSWVCPICGAGKDAFAAEGGEAQSARADAPDEDMTALSPMEISAICSNLARGCDKQYKPEEAAAFRELAEYFSIASAPAEDADTDALTALIESDLNGGIPAANAQAKDAGDRGALRALTWCEKTTRILDSLTKRYLKEGDKMLEHTGVYVCSICGFVYIGDEPPALCPVCKVQSFKFDKVEGR